MKNTLFEERRTVFHQMDPLFKLAWGTLMMIWVLYLAVPQFQLVLFIVLLTIAWAFAGINPIQLIKPVRAFITLGVFMVAFQALFARGEIVLWRWGALRVTQEGLLAGLTVGMRLILIVCISMILAITTDPRLLVAALIRYLKMPYRLAYALFATLRFLPLMRNDAVVILEAQTIRGARIDRSLWARVRQFVTLLVPLIASGIRQASQSAIALDSRAFGYLPVRSSLTKVSIRKSGPILFFVTLAAFIAYVVFIGQSAVRWMY